MKADGDYLGQKMPREEQVFRLKVVPGVLLIYACPTMRGYRNHIHYRSSSTCSTESTISLTSSSVTPGIMRSASVNALCRALSATRASCEETLGNNYTRRMSTTKLESGIKLTEAMAGKTTESSIVVSGSSSSSWISCIFWCNKFVFADEYVSTY